MLLHYGYYEKYSDRSAEEFDIIYYLYDSYHKDNISLEDARNVDSFIIGNFTIAEIMKSVAFGDHVDLEIRYDYNIATAFDMYKSIIFFDDDLSIIALFNKDYDIWRLLLIENYLEDNFIERVSGSIGYFADNYIQEPHVENSSKHLYQIFEELINYNEFEFKLNAENYSHIGTLLIQIYGQIKYIPLFDLLKKMIDTYCVHDEHIFETNDWFLSTASQLCLINVIELLLSYEFIEPAFDNGSAIKTAAQNNCFSIVKLLINDKRFYLK